MVFWLMPDNHYFAAEQVVICQFSKNTFLAPFSGHGAFWANLALAQIGTKLYEEQQDRCIIVRRADFLRL